MSRFFCNGCCGKPCFLFLAYAVALMGLLTWFGSKRGRVGKAQRAHADHEAFDRVGKHDDVCPPYIPAL